VGRNSQKIKSTPQLIIDEVKGRGRVTQPIGGFFAWQTGTREIENGYASVFDMRNGIAESDRIYAPPRRIPIDRHLEIVSNMLTLISERYERIARCSKGWAVLEIKKIVEHGELGEETASLITSATGRPIKMMGSAKKSVFPYSKSA